MLGNRWVELGKVVKPHGLRGDFIVHSPSGPSSALSYLKEVILGSPEPSLSLKIREAVWTGKVWKVGTEEINHIDDAEDLRGMSVYVTRNSLMPLTGDEFYVEDLVGLKVIDADKNTPVGQITSVEWAAQGGHHERKLAQDKWWVETSQGHFCIPATKKYISSVDINEGSIRVKNLSELVDDFARE